MTCVACVGDSDCSGYTATPHCGANGACVACADNSQCANPTPACDNGTHSCRACQADTECSSLACDLGGGTCLDEATIIYASPTGGCAVGAKGTKADPVGLGCAFDLASAQRPNIKALPGTYPSSSPIVLGGGVEETLWGGAGVTMGATLEPVAGATLHIMDMTFATTGTLLCNPAGTGNPIPSLDLVRSSWADSGNPIQTQTCKLSLSEVHLRDSGGAVLITADGDNTMTGGTTIKIDRSWFEGGAPAIALLHYSKLTVTNSVFETQDPNYGPLKFDLTTLPSSIAFSTIYNSPLKCATTATPLVQSSNNVYYATSGTDVVSGNGCNHTWTMMMPQATMPTGDGTNVRNVNPSFANPATGDFHLLLGSPAIDVADPAATDPIDYDAVSRPQGARRDMGAYEYKP